MALAGVDIGVIFYVNTWSAYWNKRLALSLTRTQTRACRLADAYNLAYPPVEPRVPVVNHLHACRHHTASKSQGDFLRKDT